MTFLLAFQKSWREVLDLVLLQNPLVRQVTVGTVALSAAAGIVGTFMLLRRRALVADVVAHAALPGIGAAFLFMELLWPGSGRWTPGLLIGAALSGLLGAGLTTMISRSSRIKDDAALAVVLGLFFGTGVVLFSIIQSLSLQTSTGLEHFIFGRTALLTQSDVRLMVLVSILLAAGCLLLFKEFSLLCFDAPFAATRGWPVHRLDLFLTFLLVGLVVMGMPSVGLLVVVAMPLIPPATARLWTDRLPWMAALAAVLGMVSAWSGVVLSSLGRNLSTGPLIVLVAGGMFLVSLVLAPNRGLLPRWRLRRHVRQQVHEDDLMRAMFEAVEHRLDRSNDRLIHQLIGQSVARSHLQSDRTWNAGDLDRTLARLQRRGLLRVTSGGSPELGHAVLTEAGAAQALRAVRRHRLWELYLIRHADLPPEQVDRSADAAEHVLEPEELAGLDDWDALEVPANPHGA